MKIKYITHENEISEKWKPVANEPNKIVVVDGKTYTVITRQITEQGTLVSNVIKKREFRIPLNDEFYEPSFQDRVTVLPTTSQQESPLTYMIELQEKGFVHLCDYLKEMNTVSTHCERRELIRKMSFSSFSHVVLETMEAISQKVENSIPIDSRNVLFLVGPTGSGKTTTMCFLRGDNMKLKQCNWISEDDKSGLIGHSMFQSCTFLPKITVRKELTIIDYPGFSDTNGLVTSLGMKFILRRLINKYDSRILVLEPITDDGSRYANAANLGLQLDLLLASKKNCFLGLTKYSCDPDFIDIEFKEEQLKRDLIRIKEQKLIELKAELNLFNELVIKIPQLESMIESKEREIAEFEKTITEPQLPDPIIEGHQKNILEKEKEFSRQIGIENIIRFSKLDDPNLLSSCIATLSEPQDKQIAARTYALLDFDDRKLLDELFEGNLMKEIDMREAWHMVYNDFEDFAGSIEKSSLINTLFSDSNPEVGKFFHLPEIDPSILRQYDLKIIKSCIDKYIGTIICALDILLINKKIKEMKIPRDKVVVFYRKLIKAKECMMDLLGMRLAEKSPEELEKEWVETQRQYMNRAKYCKERYKIPTWARDYLGIPMEFLNGLFLFDCNKKSEVNQETIEKVMDDCNVELDNIEFHLNRLECIKQIILTL